MTKQQPYGTKSEYIASYQAAIKNILGFEFTEQDCANAIIAKITNDLMLLRKSYDNLRYVHEHSENWVLDSVEVDKSLFLQQAISKKEESLSDWSVYLKGLVSASAKQTALGL